MISNALIKIIRFYQLIISPLFGNCCRFYPSCSNYSMMAIAEHGALRGIWLSLIRLCKCHPFHPGGVDMVPMKRR
ncbi:MAG: membrane protein insertion efficiency factor YidD [Lentisphaerae bacterium]|nr:membrane protein insertion efficiency factor YidD [Lentisphaerota bacterium]